MSDHGKTSSDDKVDDTKVDVSANNRTQNSQNLSQVVVPGENSAKIRKGQVDWVEGLERFSDLKSWLFKYRVGANIYLSSDVYPNPKERRQAWLYALVRASVLGKNEQMTKYLEVLDHKEVTCEQLLVHLEKRFLPTVEYERKRVVEKYRAFKRENKSLWDAYKAFQHLELECSKYKFNPGIEMNIAQLQSLVLPDERAMFRLFVDRESKRLEEEFEGEDHDDEIEAMTESEREEEAIRCAIETLGKELEDRDFHPKKQLQEKGGNSHFAGYTLEGRDRGKGGRGGRGRGRGGKQGSSDRETESKQQNNSKGRGQGGKFQRSGHPPRENEEKDGKICKYCNQECPAVKGGKKEQCYAWGKDCKQCGKKGHYQSVCRMKQGVVNVAYSGGGERDSDTGADGGKISSGF